MLQLLVHILKNTLIFSFPSQKHTWYGVLFWENLIKFSVGISDAAVYKVYKIYESLGRHEVIGRRVYMLPIE